MLEKVGKAGRIVGTLVLVAVVVLVAVLAAPGVIGAKESFVVLSGSMEPEIQAGDVVVVKEVPTEDIEVGDVITYDSNGELGGERTDRVTHRVIDVRQTDSGTAFKTQGDANEDPDPGLVQPSQVIGVMWFHVPAVGKAILFAQQPWVQGLLIVVPGVLLMASGVKTLYDAATGGTETEEEPSEGADDEPTAEGDTGPSAKPDGTRKR
jgi:signal peptidase